MPKKILLVEDEPLIAFNESKQLQKHGFEVEIAYSGEKAIERVRSEPDISLILMDIDLSEGIDGTEAARKILDSREIPIVVFLMKELTHRVKNNLTMVSSLVHLKDSEKQMILLSSLSFRIPATFFPRMSVSIIPTPLVFNSYQNSSIS
ncbi:MAG: response regulator [Spirochaetia bacterium]